VAKSEVLIKMPEFRNDYELGMVEAEKISSRVKPKQFLHIDEAECILCEVVFDVCPWKCIFYLSLEAITASSLSGSTTFRESVIASRER
jgi:formate hydrogenlyase subunit 6/NADH:ubiquinone oxidoreductase subunit I